MKRSYEEKHEEHEKEVDHALGPIFISVVLFGNPTKHRLACDIGHPVLVPTKSKRIRTVESLFGLLLSYSQ